VHKFLVAVKNKSLHYLNLGWIERIKRDESLLITNWNLVEAVDITPVELDSYKVQCKFQENKLFLIYSALQLVGKVDKRFSAKQQDIDIFDDMLSGMKIDRKTN